MMPFKCFDVLVEPYGRVKLLQDRLKSQLDELRFNQLERHPKLLREKVQNHISNVFQTPRIRFYVVRDLLPETFLAFLKENKLCPASDKDLRNVDVYNDDISEWKFMGPVVHITLLTQENMQSEFVSINEQ